MKIFALLRLFYAAYLVYILYMLISFVRPDDPKEDILLFALIFILTLAYMTSQVWESVFVFDVRVRKPFRALRIYVVVIGLIAVIGLVISIPLENLLHPSTYRAWILIGPMVILLIVDIVRPWRTIQSVDMKDDLPFDHPSNF